MPTDLIIAALFIVGLVLYAIGARLFGIQHEGGSRAVVGAVGSLSLGLGVYIGRTFWGPLTDFRVATMLMLLLSLTLTVFGAYLVIMSVTASNERIRQLLAAVIRGL